ncbi:hypothetical protein Dtox_1010 [Desulfofarcimen acetoxidans DSM 771]|uniref:Uncharacterized protein n=1 Tax=Desulfofarcimen acetoxidans (strain ATCC 49208 / DSM 771 / KCTC 5769 / VKM B-1644 / 5575) TaxID=485916 RepID=C8W3C9_DESAS|nr:hypothetical protein [Desulfofarcimen acetoxidans]ACV61896.1 hypothetical protein Dtox_1010 [Desulfofarcimen acetoxidans DSM 771]
MSHDHHTESKSSAIIKAVILFILSGIIYYMVFTNAKALMDLLTNKTYYAPLISMSITVVVSYIFGAAISKLCKCTLEQTLESQVLREE